MNNRQLLSACNRFLKKFGDTYVPEGLNVGSKDCIEFHQRASGTPRGLGVSDIALRRVPLARWDDVERF